MIFFGGALPYLSRRTRLASFPTLRLPILSAIPNTSAATDVTPTCQLCHIWVEECPMNMSKKVWPDQPCILSITLESLVGRHTQLWMVDTECSSYFTKRSTWFCIKTFLTRRSRDSRQPRPSLAVVLVPLWSLEVADPIEVEVHLFFKISWNLSAVLEARWHQPGALADTSELLSPCPSRPGWTIVYQLFTSQTSSWVFVRQFTNITLVYLSARTWWYQGLALTKQPRSASRVASN